MECVLDPVNMEMAWKRVKRNKGAPGIDGMAVGDFPEFARENWERIASQLRKGIYHPAPVRRVLIPKADGTDRASGSVPNNRHSLQWGQFLRLRRGRGGAGGGSFLYLVALGAAFDAGGGEPGVEFGVEFGGVVAGLWR
jgi:hypothetical protein